MSSKLHQLVLFIQSSLSWRPLANYAVKAGMVCLQVKLCDPHLRALQVRFSRWRYTNLRLPLPVFTIRFTVILPSTTLTAAFSTDANCRTGTLSSISDSSFYCLPCSMRSQNTNLFGIDVFVRRLRVLLSMYVAKVRKCARKTDKSK